DVVDDLPVDRRHRLEHLVAPRLDGPLGRLAGELGQRLLTAGPVAGHVDVDAGAVAADTALDRGADELLDGIDRGGAGPDQETEVLPLDVDIHVVVTLGPGGHGGRQPETLDETPGEGLSQLSLLLE